MKEPKKILVIRAGMLGDVLMTTPLISSVRKKYPQSKIYYLVGDWSKSALQGNKDIYKLIVFDDSIIFERKLFKVIELIKRLRKERFDLCLILDKSYLWNLFAFLTRSKVRIGFNRKWEGFLNTKNVDFNGSKYELDYYLDVVRLLDIEPDKDMKISIPKEDEKFAADVFKNINFAIGIAPGGAQNPGQSFALKRWPIENYVALIKKLNKKLRYQVILFGGKDDATTAKEIEKDAKVINFAGKLSIPRTAALIKKCRLFITHDSGLMHLAAAVKTPVIALFGPTSAVRFAPKDSVVIKSHLNCAPCYDIYGNYKKCETAKCMESIDVEEVESVIHKVLKGS